MFQGKTFLSAAAIAEARARHCTLFAFPSHDTPGRSTARAIIHSLLFQLASFDRSVQSLLINTDDPLLLSSTSKSSQFFKTILETFGPTYIIIDGLDEMETTERSLLINSLLAVERCAETKVLLSSRLEDDIMNVLQKRATSIRVDQKNAASIQSYVDLRIQQWMQVTQFFDKAAQRQIHNLLRPLVSKANGESASHYDFSKVILLKGKIDFTIRHVPIREIDGGQH